MPVPVKLVHSRHQFGELLLKPVDLFVLFLDDGMQPEKAARRYLRDNPGAMEGWLAGVTTLDGNPGLAAVRASLGL